MFFGILIHFRGPHIAEKVDTTRLVEDSCYISTNKLVERMLVTGQVPTLPDELYDETEEKNDYEIPSDAPLRNLDSDITDADAVAGQLQFCYESNRTVGEDSGGDRIEGEESDSGDKLNPEDSE